MGKDTCFSPVSTPESRCTPPVYFYSPFGSYKTPPTPCVSNFGETWIQYFDTQL